MGLGATTPAEIENAEGEITSITFQKVDTGNVTAALPVDSFVKVNWEDAPTRPPAPEADDQEGLVRQLHNRLTLDQIQASDVKPDWRAFTDVIAVVKDAVLKRVSTQSLNCVNQG